ncbi:MAG: right-handed parallel beta-helix repeat-containing protein, partial [Promethearchaeota archaeon]
NADLINMWGYGINLGSCKNCTLSGNTASNNFNEGLAMWYCDDINIIGNTFNFNRYGISASDIDDCKIEGNIISGDPDFFDNWDVGIYLQYESANITLINNQMTYCGLMLGYEEDLANQDGLLSSDFSNGGQVFLINTNNSVIENLQIFNTTIGIHLYYSNDNKISNCHLKHNKLNSFEMFYSHNNVITGNTFEDSNENHLTLHGCNHNNITDNTITDDPVNNARTGLVLDGCNYSSVLRNDIHNCHEGITLNGIYNEISQNNISNNQGSGIYLASWGTGDGYNTIFNNTLTYNWDGLVLDNVDNNDILNNTMSYNRGFGLILIDSDFNTVSNNIFYCNREGCISEAGCFGNIFDNNTCEECPIDDGTNGPWVSGYDLLILIGVLGITVFLLRKRKLKL